MADLINVKDWKRYIKWVASENKKIKRKNEDLWAKAKKSNAAFTESMEAINVRTDKLNKANSQKFEDEQKAWDAKPWHKKLNDDRPWIYPYHIPPVSTLSWYMPLCEGYKQPSIEEYLTWLTMPTKPTAKRTRVTRRSSNARQAK